jgi:hypothetical protein
MGNDLARNDLAGGGYLMTVVALGGEAENGHLLASVGVELLTGLVLAAASILAYRSREVYLPSSPLG